MVFKRVPGDPQRRVGRARPDLYYTLEAMGLLDKYHQKVFDAIHKDNVNLANQKIRDAVARQEGIDPAKYAEVEKSFTRAVTKMSRAAQLIGAYKVDGVPSVIVNGKYVTSTEHAGGPENVFPVVEQLIAMARKDMAAVAAPRPPRPSPSRPRSRLEPGHADVDTACPTRMVVFLTGASSGIGEALARHYAAQGATLGLVARRARAPRAASRVASLGGRRPTPPTCAISRALKAAAADFIARHGVPGPRDRQCRHLPRHAHRAARRTSTSSARSSTST